ncbi:rho gtpase-activating protein 68f [Anaeramoeba ignava]|uniref:Rho gtpase-activating protein 68f n=1 Tax=Anaeramoeba ignava TaxID=1746090 RepID=A0A9Q0RE27_ANAIG|nr:rho gtpase-activating protein 68f [Anaeramoeba ignava]
MSSKRKFFRKGTQKKTTKLLGEVSPIFPIHPFIIRCIEEVEERGLNTVGIFRISSSSQRIKEITTDLSQDKEVLLSELDIITISALIKQYFRELPEPILTTNLYDTFVKLADLEETEQFKKVFELFQSLPFYNKILALVLLRLLKKVSENCSINMMGIENLALIFGPTFLKKIRIIDNNLPQPDPLEVVRENEKVAKITSLLINNFDKFKQVLLKSPNIKISENEKTSSIEDSIIEHFKTIDTRIYESAKQIQQIKNENKKFKMEAKEKVKELKEILKEEKGKVELISEQQQQQLKSQNDNQQNLTLLTKELIEKKKKARDLTKKKQKTKRKNTRLHQDIRSTTNINKQEKTIFQEYQNETQKEVTSLQFNIKWMNEKINELEDIQKNETLNVQFYYEKSKKNIEKYQKRAQIFEQIQNQVKQLESDISQADLHISKNHQELTSIVSLFEDEKKITENDIEQQEKDIHVLKEEIQIQEQINQKIKSNILQSQDSIIPLTQKFVDLIHQRNQLRQKIQLQTKELWRLSEEFQKTKENN